MTISIKFIFPIPEEGYIKYGFYWPSGFRKKDV